VEPPAELELLDGYARFRHSGRMTFADALSQGAAAVAYCREQKVRRLLVDATGLQLPEPPRQMDRFDFGTRLAEAGQSAVKVAVVARAEMLDPQRLGAVVARNRGMLAQSFDNYEAALAWLLDPAAK
jgi:hypothetical protein